MTSGSLTPGHVYLSRRVAPLLLVGFASGLPLALTGGTLQAWATQQQVSLQDIGLLTLVGSAYTLKFFWAPVVDRFAAPWLGRRRGWMIAMQLILAAALMAMGLLDPKNNLSGLAAIAVFVAFCSATQDIAIDAYRSDVLRTEERGAGAALSVMGYRLAMLTSGGLALILADNWLGWGGMYVCMGVIMLVASLGTFWASEPEHVAKPPVSLSSAVIEPLKEFFSRPEAGMVLVLIVLYKLGDAFASALSTTFLLRAAGYTVTEVGTVNKLLGLAATIAGALAGGALMARLGLFRSLFLFGVLQAVSNLAFWVVSIGPHSVWLMAAGIGIENLCSGMGTAAFVARLMGLCKHEFSATQFALLSALSAVGRTYLAGPLSPPLVEYLGWPHFFLFTVIIGVPGLMLLYWRRHDIEKLDITT